MKDETRVENEVKYTKAFRPMAVSVLCSIFLLAALTVGQTLPGRENGKIAFASTITGYWEIYSMNSDGSGRTRLTYRKDGDGEGAIFPSWSPDGKRIAYLNITNSLDPYYHLKLMGADGSDQTTIATVFNSYPIGVSFGWSPDGKKIAFNSAGDIYVVNIDGSELRNLTQNFANDGEPTWSPDGSRIAFTSNRTSSPYGIHIMNADGSNVQQYGTGNFSFAPKWSPDGQRLLFLTDNQDGFNYDLISANISGSSVDFLAIGVEGADWSPDGTKIVFSPGIFIMNVAGGNVTQIGPFDCHYPDWQPLSRGGSISGKITAPDGRGLRDAMVFLTDSLGVRRSTLSSTLGYFQFENVTVGERYNLRVASRRYRFEPRELEVNGALTDVDLVGFE